MSLIKIVCANCGAQYRLPETFQADKAKCKKCGASIDVAGQRQAPVAEAATPTPSAPRTVEAASSPTRSSRRTARASADGGAASGRRSSRAAGGGKRRGRRAEGGDDEAGGKKKKNGALVWGSVGLLAAIVVVLIFVLKGGGDGSTANETAKAGEPSAPGQAEAAAATEEAGAPETPPPAAEADAKSTEESKAEDAAAAAEKAAEKPAPQPSTHELKTPEDVFNPMKETQPVAWPDYVTAEDRALISQLVDDVESGGASGIKAKKALEGMGHKALAPIINKLRELDYMDAWESQTAYEFNKLLGAITMGQNVGFKSVDAAEEVSLEKADWNAKTAKAWQGLMTKFATKEAFDTYIAERSKDKK